MIKIIAEITCDYCSEVTSIDMSLLPGITKISARDVAWIEGWFSTMRKDNIIEFCPFCVSTGKHEAYLKELK